VPLAAGWVVLSNALGRTQQQKLSDSEAAAPEPEPTVA
jgi:hypothetical protein